MQSVKLNGVNHFNQVNNAILSDQFPRIFSTRTGRIWFTYSGMFCRCFQRISQRAAPLYGVCNVSFHAIGCALHSLPRAAVGPGKLVRKMTLREISDWLAGAGEKRRSVNLKRLWKFRVYNNVVLVINGRGIHYEDQNKTKQRERGEENEWKEVNK